ncbi:MAG: PEGA domain-containing protein [Gemmatimonadota bacterium]
MTTQVDPRLPRILDDVWDPPPRPKRLRIVVGTSAGVLVIASIIVATISSAMRDPDPPPGPVAAPAPAKNSLWYPDELRDAPGPLSTFRNSARTAAPSTPRPRAAIDDRPRPKPVVRRPAPPPPPPPPGYLSVNSMPWAVLSVDGRVVGNTPQRAIPVSAGRHQMVLARDGFETHRTWIAVQPRDTVRITGIVLKRIGP